MPPTTLSDAAHRFCEHFAHKEAIETLLTHFSNTRPCEVVEHGLSCLAPFLGSPFRGLDGVRRYFSTVAALITYEDMRFSEYIIDVEVRKASVKGTATFTWITTRESWDETFTYVLDFDDRDKITRYQIWGDTGALYLASQGRLRQVSDLAG
ncbi:transcription elongation factor S-II [Butyriboletus roseoflavus]|nr:transcription elongation factor S-II [Butyriboletus roseoflavus]